MKMGHNVFLTGSAGAGKTFVLNSYIRYLREHAVEVAITASTGIAATHMGGMTIHAWSGIGIRDTLTDWDIELMQEKKYLWDRYDKARVLVIDEVSMLSGAFLDNLDRLCRAFKRLPDAPFGGLQVILCGDLFQLPPISKNDQSDFVFASNAWKNSGFAMCYLTEQHRQDDPEFLNVLNAIRANTIDDNHREILESRLREFDADDFSGVTKLFTHNADVDAINNAQLATINEPEETFLMTHKGKGNLVETLKKSCLAPEVLKLKIGAEVMFVKNNFEKGYVNGTRGTVIDFDMDEGWPIVKMLDGDEVTASPEEWAVEDEGKVLAQITQVPLRHAWAITVHKSQGMSLDAAVIDLSKSFAYGMGYVALSRVRNLNGLHLVGFSEHALAVDPRVLAIDASLQNLSQRAESRLAEISETEIKKSQNEFIVRAGGKLEKIKMTKKTVKEKAPKTHNWQVSYDLIKSGKSIREVAKEVDFVTGTIIGHLERARDEGHDISFSHIKPAREIIEEVKHAFDAVKDPGAEYDTVKLTPVMRSLNQAGKDYSFDDIKLARLFF